MVKTIAITNQKGGVGKTTTAVNLTAILADMGQRVLVVDLDPQGNTTSGLGKKAGDKSIYEALLGREPLRACMQDTAVRGLTLVGADIRLAGAELELVEAERREFRLKELLAQVKAGYDFIFIDCPPSLSLLTLNALAAEQRRTAQRLAACWFLLTGACYHFSSPPIPRVCPLAAALREQFLQEQKWRRLCQRAAAEGDSTACGGLYETLDGQAEHRMEAIRCLLEQMQPLPSGG